jgi:hypothetical protein
MAFAQEAAAPVAAPAEAPGTQSSYHDLRRSKDRTTRQWAERYFTLTKLQEWTSANGKKVKAKYVSHTPDLTSVRLSVAQGKEVNVPVAKLDRSSQSRVKQIAATQRKLDELIAAGAKADSPQAGENPASDPGAPMVDERGAEPTRRPATTRRPPPGREVGPAPARTNQPPAAANAAPAEDSGDDPLGFGELPPNPAPQVPPAGAIPATLTGPPTITPPGNGAAKGERIAKPKDKAGWRTDYAAFRALLEATASRESPQANWSAIKELQAAIDVVKKWEDFGSADETALREIAQKFAEVGEFTWEATLTDADVSSGDWTQRLNLPPLPAPLSIGFILDKDRDPGNWQQFKAGDRVKFIGRFIDVELGEDVLVAIRFPAAAQPAAPAR